MSLPNTRMTRGSISSTSSSSTNATENPNPSLDESFSALDAELDLISDIDASFPMRRKKQCEVKGPKATSRAEKIRREHALSREIRQKMRAAEQSFRHLEMGQSIGNLDVMPDTEEANQELGRSSAHSPLEKKKKESWRKKMKKSVSMRL